MRFRIVFALLVVFGLVAAACGDTSDPTTTVPPVGDTSTTAPPPTTMAPTSTTVAPPTTVAPTTTSGLPDGWPDKIIFGFIPSERGEDLQDNIQPFMDFLAQELGIEVEGVVTADYTGLVVAMGTGQADFGAFGPFGYIQAQEQFPNVEAFIQSIRFGSATYHGQWFTNDASICDAPPEPGALENLNGEVVVVDPFDAVALQVGVTFGDSGKEQEFTEDGEEIVFGHACQAPLDSVVGKKIAFTSSTSTSGAVFPQLQLLNEGISLDDDVEFAYLGSHTDTVAAVYSGDFDIGLSFDDARRNIRNEPGQNDVGEKVIVFNITDEIPNDVVAYRNDLPSSLADAVYAATEKYLATEEGEAIFDEIYGWTDIRPAIESDFDVVREAKDKLGITED